MAGWSSQIASSLWLLEPKDVLEFMEFECEMSHDGVVVGGGRGCGDSAGGFPTCLGCGCYRRLGEGLWAIWGWHRVVF